MLKILLGLTLLFLSLSSFAQEDEITDCQGSSTFLEETGLACVHCGIQQVTGMAASDKWLAFLGASVTRNFPDANYTKAGDSREAYLRRVIEAVQADGFCLPNKLDSSGHPSAEVGFGSLSHNNKNVQSSFFKKRVTDEYDVITPLASGSMDSPRYNGEVKARWDITKDIYGFKKQKYIDNLFPSDWDELFPSQRRDVFYAVTESGFGPLNSEEEGKATGECFHQIKSLHKNYSYFSLAGKYKKDNMSLCKTMAHYCGIASRFCEGPVRAAKTGSGGASLPAPAAPSLFNKGNQ